MTRLFVAIDLDNKIKNAIESTYSLFPNSLIKARFTKNDNLHITLKFIGERSFNDINNIIDALNDAKRGTSPFQIEFYGLGAFPHVNSPRIIWVGCKNDVMGQLAANIDVALGKIGITKEKRPFSQHVTIARVKNVMKKRDVADIIESNICKEYGSQYVDKFILKKSQLTPKGPIYSNVEVFDL